MLEEAFASTAASLDALSYVPFGRKRRTWDGTHGLKNYHQRLRKAKENYTDICDEYEDPCPHPVCAPERQPKKPTRKQQNTSSCK